MEYIGKDNSCAVYQTPQTTLFEVTVETEIVGQTHVLQLTGSEVVKKTKRMTYV